MRRLVVMTILLAVAVVGGLADAVAVGDLADLGMVDDQAVREERVGLDDDVVLPAGGDDVGRVEADDQRIWLTIWVTVHAGRRLSRSAVAKFDTPMAMARPLARNSSIAFQMTLFSSRQSLPISSQGQGACTR